MLRLLIALAAAPSFFGDMPTLTNGGLAKIASAPYDKGEKSGKHEILGSLHKVRVVADYPCGDICPMYTTRIIHYDLEPGHRCEAVGGVAELRGFHFGIGMGSRLYCIPAVLRSKRPRPAQICGISGVSRTAGGVSIAFNRGRWFTINHLGKSQGYLVGPLKPGDPFANDTHIRLNAYVGDTGWTSHEETCQIEVVQSGDDLGVKLRSIYDPTGSIMKPLETDEFLPAEQGSASE